MAKTQNAAHLKPVNMNSFLDKNEKGRTKLATKRKEI